MTVVLRWLNFPLIALTTYILRRNWSAFRRLQAHANNKGVDVSMIARVSVFSFLPMGALA